MNRTAKAFSTDAAFRDPDGHHWDVFYIDPSAPARQT
jgi:predicted lactoylglutathione lyase